MKRADVDKVLIIGSGPIVIGQACEFDYSGTQACKALRACGYKVVLVNSNPATIMTDPVMADATYIEPLNEARLEQIIEKERPDAILPNLGGQTGLNLSMELAKKGILDKYGVKVIGVNLDAIERGEDREVFKATMERLGIETPRSGIVHTVEEAVDLVENNIGYPVVVRPAYTMGGSGGGFCYNVEELRTICARGLDASLTTQCLIEESILNWEELEVEVLAALSKLTAEYGKIGGNLNQIARSLNEYGSPYRGLEKEVRGAAADLAALKFEVLQKVGEAVGDTQTYQL